MNYWEQSHEHCISEKKGGIILTCMLPYGPKSENGLTGGHKAGRQKHLKILTKYYVVIIVICRLPYNDHPLTSDSSTIWKKKCQTLILV